MLIDIRDITKVYVMGAETVHALSGVTLGVERGEYVGIMGPSGSGKSTLMNLIGCLDTPTAGSYVLNGREVARMTDDELAASRSAWRSRGRSSTIPRSSSPTSRRETSTRRPVWRSWRSSTT